MATTVLEATVQVPSATHGVVMGPATDTWLTTTVGNANASTPDAAALDIVGDLELVVRMAMTDYTPTDYQTVLSKWATSNLSYLWDVEITSGKFRFVSTADGVTPVVRVATTAPTFSDTSCYWFKVTFDADNGAGSNVTTFWYADDNDTEPLRWIQIGLPITVAGVATIFSGTAPLHIGGRPDATFGLAGKFFFASVRSEIASFYGTKHAFSCDFTKQTAGATSITAGTGQTVTVPAMTADPNPWRFAVEALVANGGGRVGVGRVGVAKVSDFQWWDITPDLTGLETNQGRPPTSPGFPRPDTGVCSFTLDNSSGKYSPWNTNLGTLTDGAISTPYLNREWNNGRTIIRVVMFKANAFGRGEVADSFFWTSRAHWHCVFTGYLEDWTENLVKGRNVVTATVVETSSFLANVQKGAVTAYGAGDTLAIRMYRLLGDAGFPFYVTPGIVTTTFTNALYSLQATTASANRWQEVVLSCRSVNAALIWADTDGNLNLGYSASIRYNTDGTGTYPDQILRLTTSAQTVAADKTNFPRMTTANVAGEIQLSTQADWIANDITAQNVGGLAQNLTTTESVGAYGLRPLALTNLIGQTDSMAFNVAFYELYQADGYVDPNVYLAAGDLPQNVLPGSLKLSQQHDAQRTISLNGHAFLDWYPQGATSPAVRLLGRTVGIRHTFTKTASGVLWDTDLTLLPRYNYEV